MLEKIINNGGYYIPEGFINEWFVFFTANNIDFQEDTPDSKGTTHATAIANISADPVVKLSKEFKGTTDLYRSPLLIAAHAHEFQTFLTILKQAQGINTHIMGPDEKCNITDFGFVPTSKATTYV